MNKTLIVIVMLITGIAAWQSFRVSSRMGEKIDHLYRIPGMANQFMDEGPTGEFVRTATAFKFDPGAIFVIGLLNLIAFILSTIAVIREGKKTKAQPGQPG